MIQVSSSKGFSGEGELICYFGILGGKLIDTECLIFCIRRVYIDFFVMQMLALPCSFLTERTSSRILRYKYYDFFNWISQSLHIRRFVTVEFEFEFEEMLGFLCSFAFPVCCAVQTLFLFSFRVFDTMNFFYSFVLFIDYMRVSLCVNGLMWW